MAVELRKSFTNYGSNKHRSCNWVVSHLRITVFYAKQTAPEMRISPEKDLFFMIGGQPNVILSYNESIMICYNETQFAYRNSIELQIS